MKRYRTIVADPPWEQKGGPLKGGHGEGFVGTAGSHDLPYPTLTLAEIKSLPVGGLADENCHLYLWTTNKWLPEAFEVVKAWGFRYSTTLVWSKAMMGGGLGGTWRINTEFCLFAYRGRVAARGCVRGTEFTILDYEHNHAFPAVADWKRPYKRGKPQHSAKPLEFFDEVERVSHGPYLELFSRRDEVARFDWDYHGDESLGTVELVA